VGETGRSKTFSFNIFNEFTKRFCPQENYMMLSAPEIETFFGTVGQEAKTKYLRYRFNRETEDFKPVHVPRIRHVYIDEIGFEEAEIKHYGTRIKPMETVLFQRHKDFLKKGEKTHISTNLQPSAFKTRYSQRIYSRMFEMFNIINTSGIDLRTI